SSYPANDTASRSAGDALISTRAGSDCPLADNLSVCRSESGVKRANRRVTFARDRLETQPICDDDVTVCVSDEPRRLKHSGDGADRLASHAQHHRESFLADVKALPAHVIVGHQQPPRTARVDVMTRIARGQTDELSVKCLRE